MLKHPVRLLVLYKKSAYEAYFRACRSGAMRRHLRRGDPVLGHFKRSHEAHYRTLDAVRRELTRRGIHFELSPRGRAIPESARYDWVIAVGGDGTVLEAARVPGNPAVLGVNSDPSHSVGAFCSADRVSFPDVLGRVLRGRRRGKLLDRLSVAISGRRLKYGALNDVLFTHANPAAMSHYLLSVGRVSEQQRSSGLWIATAAGSTGALGSAGGRRMPTGSKKFQYRPRELYLRPRRRFRLRGGVLAGRSRVVVRSLMHEGVVYLDGAHRRYRLGYGDTMEVRLDGPRLRLL